MASRTYEYALVEATIFQFLAGLNAEAADSSRGELLGLVSFVAKEAVFRGAAFRGSIVAHTGWGSNSKTPSVPAARKRAVTFNASVPARIYSRCASAVPARTLFRNKLMNKHIRFKFKLPLDLAHPGSSASTLE